MFTWDDGTNDHAAVADAATARGQSHTFFINSSRIGTAGFLASSQVTGMYTAGHEIGNHCKNHTDLNTLTVSQRQAQYDDSQAAIESWTAVGACRSLAYPYGFHSTAIDQETALRYDRTFLVNNVNQIWRQPIFRSRSHNLSRLTWSSARHQAVLQAIRAAAVQDTVTVIMGHRVGAGGVITEAEMLEGLDLAANLGVRCVTVADALPCSNRLIDPSFELPLGAWIGNGDASVVADAPMSGMGGAQSLKLTSTANSYSEVIQSIPINDVEPMTLSGRYHTNQATGYIHVVIRPFTAAGSWAAAEKYLNLAVPSPWARFTTSFTPPAGTVALQVIVFVQNSGDAYLDHLWLTPDTHGALG